MIEADALGETNRIVAGSWKARPVAFQKIIASTSRA
jgi:hypothetical protein